MPIEVYSFFAGIGFLDLGFENAGFNIVFVNEINPSFILAYQFARKKQKDTLLNVNSDCFEELKF